MLLVTGLVAVVAASAFAAISLGNDDDPATADTTSPTATAEGATPGATEDVYPGPAPEMTDHITQIIPEHGGQMKQALTRQTAGQSGVCAVVSYKDLPENNQWFRMAVDDKEVTQELTLIPTSRDAPEGATMCYAPVEGLEVGRHTAAIIVQNPRSTGGVALETVAWKFEVVE